MTDLMKNTGSDVVKRAQKVPIRAKRFNPDKGFWTFAATGSNGETHTVRLKGVRKTKAQTRLDRAQVKCSCTCNFFRWQGPEHWAKRHGYLYGKPRGTASTPNVRDPKGRHWVCKHIAAALNLARTYRFASEQEWSFAGDPEPYPSPARVVARWLEAKENKVKVTRKDTGKTVHVTEKTLEEKGKFYVPWEAKGKKPKKDDRSEGHQVVETIMSLVNDDMHKEIREAPKPVQKFIYDGDHRQKVLAETGKALASGSKKLVKVLKETAAEVSKAFGANQDLAEKLIDGDDLSDKEEAAVQKIMGTASRAATQAAADKSLTEVIKTFGGQFLNRFLDKVEAAASKELLQLFKAGKIADHLFGLLSDSVKTGAEKKLTQDVLAKGMAAMAAEYVRDALGSMTDEDLADMLNG
jgi:predicted SpoU family rRNA methylase